jgi:pyrimidine operon attenuation protein/uracil phosphoribosyltransferase
MSQKVLLTKEVNIILHRLACQLKNTSILKTILLVGFNKGTFLAERLKEVLENEYNTLKSNYLDITFF